MQWKTDTKLLPLTFDLISLTHGPIPNMLLYDIKPSLNTWINTGGRLILKFG